MVRQALLHVLPDWRSRVALYRFASLIIASIVRGVLCVAFARSRACSKSAAAGLQPPTQDVSSTLHNLQAETLECGQRLTRANQLHFRLGAIGLIVMDIQVSCDDVAGGLGGCVGAAQLMQALGDGLSLCLLPVGIGDAAGHEPLHEHITCLCRSACAPPARGRLR